MAAIGVGVVEHQVSVVAHHILGTPAQNSLGGRINEGCFAFGIQPVDPLARCAKNQLVLLFNPLEHLLDPLPTHFTLAVLAT